MKILLIFVRGITHFNLLNINHKQKVVAFPPAGLMYIAGYLESKGYKTYVSDTAIDSSSDVINLIRKHNIPIVGISFIGHDAHKNSKLLAENIKKYNRDIKVVLGGVFASFNCENILKKCKYFDFVVRGEGEETFVELVENITNPKSVDGVCWRSDQQIVWNPDRDTIENLDALPFPKRDFGIEYLETFTSHPPFLFSYEKFTIFLSSRGCYFNCTYCSCAKFSRNRCRLRSVENVLEELVLLNDLGYKKINFMDDNFLLDRKRVENICKGIIKEKLDIKWGCQARVDSSSLDLFILMKKANCEKIFFGIESANQRMLNIYNRGHSINKAKEAIVNAKRASIDFVHGFFLIGGPGEKLSEIQATFKFATQSKLDTFNFGKVEIFKPTFRT